MTGVGRVEKIISYKGNVFLRYVEETEMIIPHLHFLSVNDPSFYIQIVRLAAKI